MCVIPAVRIRSGYSPVTASRHSLNAFQVDCVILNLCLASSNSGSSRVDGYCSDMGRALCIIDGDLGTASRKSARPWISDPQRCFPTSVNFPLTSSHF